MKHRSSFFLFVLLLAISSSNVSALQIPYKETIRDDKNDWIDHFASISPEKKYLDTIDITTAGYLVDMDIGTITLRATFEKPMIEDGQYQLQYQMEYHFTNIQFFIIDCLELLNTNSDIFSRCEVEFWQSFENNSTQIRYENYLPKYDFRQIENSISWKFNLAEILVNETRTDYELDDIFEMDQSWRMFNTNPIAQPKLDLQMGVATNNSDLVHDDLFRGENDTTYAKEFWKEGWVYPLIGFFLIIILINRKLILQKLGILQRNE